MEDALIFWDPEQNSRYVASVVGQSNPSSNEYFKKLFSAIEVEVSHGKKNAAIQQLVRNTNPEYIMELYEEKLKFIKIYGINFSEIRSRLPNNENLFENIMYLNNEFIRKIDMSLENYKNFIMTFLGNIECLHRYSIDFSYFELVDKFLCNCEIPSSFEYDAQFRNSIIVNFNHTINNISLHHPVGSNILLGIE